MEYSAKTNWRYNEVLTENDMNRIEGGIEAAYSMINSVSTKVTDLNENAVEALLALRLNFNDLAIEVETLKKAQLTGVSANILVESFLNTNDITSLNGAMKFDPAHQKIYLS